MHVWSEVSLTTRNQLANRAKQVGTAASPASSPGKDGAGSPSSWLSVRAHPVIVSDAGPARGTFRDISYLNLESVESVLPNWRTLGRYCREIDYLFPTVGEYTSRCISGSFIVEFTLFISCSILFPDTISLRYDRISICTAIVIRQVI